MSPKNSTEFTLIVAMDEQNGIGLNNSLPWHYPEDLAYFKKTTTETQDPNKQNALIMGRKTWESIPEKFRPLPNRHNIVLSKTLKNLPGAICHNTLENALENLPQNTENTFIIGGANLFEQTLNHPSLKKLIVTKIPPISPAIDLPGLTLGANLMLPQRRPTK